MKVTPEEKSSSLLGDAANRCANRGPHPHVGTGMARLRATHPPSNSTLPLGEIPMKAIVFTEYGPPDVLQLKEVDKPTPKDNEILIRVYATPVNYGDITTRNFRNISPRKFTMPLPLWLPARIMFGFRKPRIKILGSEFAGEIEAIGKDVTRFRKGDKFLHIAV